jgi:hypothetical protein
MRDRYYDNTRISTAKRCFRKYYFRHYKDWDKTGFNKDLAFGSAWHEGMDIIWTRCSEHGVQNLNIRELADEAYEAFLVKWCEEGGEHPMEMGPEMIDILGAKHPFVAHEMYNEYIPARTAFFSDPTFELIACEQPFAVPLDPSDETLFYVGRMDKVFRKGGLIYIGEHKTTSLYSKEAGFRSTFMDSFSPNSQVDGYLHAAHMLYGETAAAVWVDAALCHKKIHDVFRFIPIERKYEQLDAWLYDTRWWVDAIEQSWDVVEKTKSSDPFLMAFPKNTEACMDYGRSCPFIGPCKMIPNPSGTNLPDGYTVDRWSPFDRLHLEELGMEK